MNNYKNWLLLAGALALLWVGYDAGKHAGRDEMSVRVRDAEEQLATSKRLEQEVADHHAKQMQDASRLYQQAKAEAEKKQRERIVRVEKIVEKPVYRNDCIDKDGLDEINKAIKNPR